MAQLVEHLTVECCSNQMVPGWIPGGRIFLGSRDLCRVACALIQVCASKAKPGWSKTLGRY